MSLTSSYEYIHYVECDGCRARAPFGFCRFVAIFKAKVAGFHRHETPNDKEKQVCWLCSKCQAEYDTLQVPVPVEKAPLQVVATRS